MKTILIDISNKHGEGIKQLLITANISFIWETITTPYDIVQIVEKYKTAIYCIPIAWDTHIAELQDKCKEYGAYVITARDVEYSEPANWADYVAEYPITWITSTENITGTSAACAFATYKESKKWQKS